MRLRSCLLDTEAWEGAGDGLEVFGAAVVLGAAAVLLFDILLEEEVRFDLKALS